VESRKFKNRNLIKRPKTAGQKTAGVRYLLLTAVVLFSLVSCATPLQLAERAFAGGDYIAAAESALQALEKEPGMNEAEQILYDAWMRGNEEWRAGVARYKDAKAVWDVEKALPFYDKLIHLHTLLKNARRLDFSPDPDKLRGQRDAVVDRLVEMHVFEASKLIVPGTRDEALIALNHILRAKELDPDYPLIESKVKQIQELATAKVFVFTGPEGDVTLNGTEIVPAIEDGLERLDGVRVVRVKNRYAAPIDDNYKADEFAKGHGANLMLHVEPATRRSVEVEKNFAPLSGAPWGRETLTLKASATTDIRYVLINLETDTRVSEGTFTVSASDNGGFSVSAILHQGEKRQVDLGGDTGVRSLLINRASVGMSELTLRYQLKVYDDLDVSDYASESTLNISAALYGTWEKIDLDEYLHPSELARITDLRDHTFWLFDAIAYDAYSDGNLTYQMVYQQQLDTGTIGHLTTAAYDRDLYKKIEAWMRQSKVKEELINQFFPVYYRQTLPARIVEKVAPLF
jgi:post-segregation antitoxin (ccd killing protein)